MTHQLHERTEDIDRREAEDVKAKMDTPPEEPPSRDNLVHEWRDLWIQLVCAGRDEKWLRAKVVAERLADIAALLESDT